MYIDVAHVIARADEVNITYASQNTGSVFTSPDSSATIQYKQISTRHRINLWEIFVLTPLVIGALALALYFCVTISSLEMKVLTTVLILMAGSLFFLPVILELHEAKKVIK